MTKAPYTPPTIRIRATHIPLLQINSAKQDKQIPLSDEEDSYNNYYEIL